MAQARQGDRVALGRLLSLIEEQGDAADEVERLVVGAWPRVVVGITGAPGAGKSTLTDQLIGSFRQQDFSVAVVAIDPSSPTTGGAILGDRVRMTDHAVDDRVLIRSVATRGAAGGLAVAVPGTLRVIGATGFDVAIVETVGVGQIELDVAALCDTVVVVVNPGWGDDVQAVKAGLLEIADVFVVNKADLPSVAQTESDLRSAMSLRMHTDSQWHIPVVRTVARTGDGVAQLHGVIGEHKTWLDETGERELRRQRRHHQELAARVRDVFVRQADRCVDSAGFASAVHEVDGGTTTVGDAVRALMKGFVFRG